MARTKQTARKREARGAQRRPARIPRACTSSSSVAEAAVQKFTVSQLRATLYDHRAPGAELHKMFNQEKVKMESKAFHLEDGPNVSLEGIDDVVNELNKLKTLLNRAYAKEKWKGNAVDGHEIASIDMKDESLGLVLKVQAVYDPLAEPVFSVYNADCTYEYACTSTTDQHGTTVDMGSFGSYRLSGATGSRERSWTFHAGEDCPDKDAIHFHRTEE